jgi:mono/diheme cytochrome c family protein
MGERNSAARGVVMAGLLLVAGTACSPMDTAMQSIFGRSMRVQPSIGPYENPQGVPDGSVPFSAGNFAALGEWNVGGTDADPNIPPPFTQAELNLANPSARVLALANPVPANAASLARGEEMYQRVCAPCHGDAGDGNGYIVESGAYPLIVSLIADNVTGYADGYIYGMIRVGRGAMPGYQHQVTHQDRWHIVNYLRQLQGVSSTQGGDVATPGNE